MDPSWWGQAFAGAWRWYPPGGTPNDLGAVAAMTACLAAGAAAWALLRGGRAGRIALIGAVVLMVAAAMVMAYARSRGAWYAAGCGLALLLAAGPGRQVRLAAGLALALALVAILAVPQAAERAIRLDPASDGSLQARVVLWRTALVAAWDHPWAGLGGHGFGPYYDRWWRPADDAWPRPEASSELLHTAAVHGIALAAALAGACIGLVAGLVHLGRKRGSPLPTGLAAVITAGAVACLPSCLLTRPLVAWTMLLAVVLGLIAMAMVAWRRHEPGVLRRAGWWSLGSAGAVAVLLLAGGWWASRPCPITAGSLALGPERCPLAAPRRGAVLGTVVVVPDPTDGDAEICRLGMADLAGGGWTAVLCRSPDAIAGALAADLPHPVWLLSLHDGGAAVATALAHAPAPPCWIAIDAAPAAPPAATRLLAVHGDRDLNASGTARPPGLAATADWWHVPWGRTWPKRLPRLIPALSAWVLAPTRTSGPAPLGQERP